MKTKQIVMILTLTLALATHTALSAPTASQLATAAKLGLVHPGFVAFRFSNSDEYLWNWQRVTGSSRQFPLSGLCDDVLLHLQKQRADIVGSVSRGIKNGTFKQNTAVRVQASGTSNAMARPSSFTDFTYAIGGCTIPTYADVTIGRADAQGNISCTIIAWVSALSDIYTFNIGDSFTLSGYPYFVTGELYSFEQAGLARRFNVASSGFYYSSLLGTFTALK